MNENNLRMRIIQESQKYLNKIARVPNKEYDCFDCEQLINVIYRDLFGISIRQNGYGKSSTTKVLTSSIGEFYSLENLSLQEKIERIHEIKPGDILFFHTQSLEDQTPTPENRYPGHVALYLGNNQFIHAKSSAGRVVIESLFDEDYLEILVGYKDLIPTIINLNTSPENMILKKSPNKSGVSFPKL